MSSKSQNQVFTDQGSSEFTLPELLKGLGTQYRFLLFKNAAAELQLAEYSGRLRFRLKMDNGAILYTTYVGKTDRIIRQVESFLLGGETFQQHFLFFSVPRELFFDFERVSKAEQLTREEVERSNKRRRRLVVVGTASMSLLAAALITSFAYVKTYSHVVFPQDLLRSEQRVRVIYSTDQIKDLFRDASIIQLIGATRDHGLNLSNRLFSLEQRINRLVISKSAEKARLLRITNEQLISEFKDETKALAEVPKDILPVVKVNQRQPALTLDTESLARALRISYRDALRLKWDLDTPAETLISPGIFHTEERDKARSTAIESIMKRFEDERPLQVQVDGLRTQLAKNQATRHALLGQALDKINAAGFVKPISLWFQVRRKPCLLLFERNGLSVELPGNQFEVELALRDQESFLDYLHRLLSPAGPVH